MMCYKFLRRWTIFVLHINLDLLLIQVFLYQILVFFFLYLWLYSWAIFLCGYCFVYRKHMYLLLILHVIIVYAEVIKVR